MVECVMNKYEIKFISYNTYILLLYKCFYLIFFLSHWFSGELVG